jgi:transcription antitermination protein NusB
MVGLRRKSRIMALQALYEIDCSAHQTEDVQSYLFQKRELDKQIIEFTQHIVNGVTEKKTAIDNLIKQFAPLFPIEQIAPVDKNILRISIFEIMFDKETPTKVAINEAIELAKTFGSDTSPKFVNGVLGSIISKLAKDNSKNAVEVPYEIKIEKPKE